jgi:hypothetical protein
MSFGSRTGALHVEVPLGDVGMLNRPGAHDLLEKAERQDRLVPGGA